MVYLVGSVQQNNRYDTKAYHLMTFKIFYMGHSTASTPCNGELPALREWL